MLTTNGRVRLFSILPWISILFLAGCSLFFPPDNPGFETPNPTLDPIPTITPFQPADVTTTPSTLRLWVSEALPAALSQTITESLYAGGRSVERTEDVETADLRIVLGEDGVVIDWVFALVTPFPSTLDSMSYDELESHWSGRSSQPKPVFVAEQDIASLESLLGERSPEHVTLIDRANLMAMTWNNRPALAIVPFGELDPRWKVLRVEGISPIDKVEDLGNYPLTLMIKLEGESQIKDDLLATLSWPRSNRDMTNFTDVIMTGVTALTRATAWTMEQKGLKYPAEKIGAWLQSADFTHVSNEVSFLSTCPPPSPVREGLIFCSNPDYVELLDFIGVDLIELTGNHIKDFGEEGLVETLEIYKSKGWEYFGGGENIEDSLLPVLIEHNGNRIAFFGCNYPGPPSVWATSDSPGATPCDNEIVFEKVSELRAEGYLPIFTFQWSEFYQAKPPRSQVEKFQEAVDAGAVIVSGSQAHQPQGFSFYRDGFIHFGVGNSFFDQMWSTVTRQEFADRHIFYNGRHISTELITLFLEDFAQPRPMSEEERVDFLATIFTASGW
jgi:poly-gamma-glutamate synthesis protein (capsule biosynthesis protein)